MYVEDSLTKWKMLLPCTPSQSTRRKKRKRANCPMLCSMKHFSDPRRGTRFHGTLSHICLENGKKVFISSNLILTWTILHPSGSSDSLVLHESSKMQSEQSKKSKKERMKRRRVERNKSFCLHIDPSNSTLESHRRKVVHKIYIRTQTIRQGLFQGLNRKATSKFQRKGLCRRFFFKGILDIAWSVSTVSTFRDRTR